MKKLNCAGQEMLDKVEVSVGEVSKSVDEISELVEDVDKSVDGVKKSLCKCDDGLDFIISQIEYMNKLLGSKHDGGKG